MSEVIDTIPQSKLRNPLFNAIWSLDSSGNPVGLVGPDGGLIHALHDPLVPLLVIGGDHPYKQWIGDATYDGTLSAYQNNGIPSPYLAINTDSEADQQNPGDTNMMSWAECVSTGMELLSHGSRHMQSWTKLNTGIKITYAGANPTATVECDGTNLILTDSGANNISLSGATLSSIVSSVGAISGWSAELAPELTGDESASNILMLATAGAKNAKAPNVARIAAGGGIVIRYSGTVYKTARVWKTGNALRLYGDNVPVASIGLTSGSTDTLAEVVSTIDALTGWDCWLCDNDNSVSALGNTYISGSESAASLLDGHWVDCKNQDAVLTAGLSNYYMLRRQLIRAKEQAEANGVTFKNYAQSGGYFYPQCAAGVSDLHDVFRGNNYLHGQAPMPWRAADLELLMPHHSISATAGYTTAAQCQAMIEALADSPGWGLNLLVHEVEPDGSSGLTIMPSQDSGALAETAWYGMLQTIKTKVDAKEIFPATMEQARMVAAVKCTPNKLFNARLKNSGVTLTGVSSNNGIIIPGWVLNTPAHVTAFTITDGVVDFTTNATTVAYLLRQDVWLKPGTTYRLRMNINSLSVTSGDGIASAFYKVGGQQSVDMDSVNAASIISGPYFTKAGVYEWFFTTPPANATPAYIRGLATQPFDLSSNTNIRININGKGLTGNINCAGGTPASTTAKEVAAAINAALAADANYPAEYHGVARAEAGKVVIEAPYDYQAGLANTNAISVTVGSANSAYATIFGTSTGQDSVAIKHPTIFTPESTSQYVFTLVSAQQGSGSVEAFAVEELK